jgi:predicted nucleic acid-binding protein
VRGIADTGFIVVFARRNHEHHDWAVNLGQEVTEPLLTCEAVLAEAAFHLESSPYVLRLINDGLLRLAFDGSRNLMELQDLARRYADCTPDLADLCLIRMSELNPRHSVITVDDSDFRFYRKNKRDTIPLISPPNRD